MQKGDFGMTMEDMAVQCVALSARGSPRALGTKNMILSTNYEFSQSTELLFGKPVRQSIFQHAKNDLSFVNYDLE